MNATKLLRAATPPALFLLVVLTLWEGLVRVIGIPTYLLPSPSTIGGAIASNFWSLLSQLGTTMAESVIGFVIGNAVGLAIAILFAHSRTAERAIYPYAIALKTTPVVALAPLLLVWLGSGLASKIAVAAIICFFPMIVNATRGLRTVEREALDLFQSLAATKTQIFFKLRLPTSLPHIFSALRISSSLSVVGAIVGEFVGAQRGLGYLIVVSSYHLEMDLMLAATIAAAFGGVVFFGMVALAESALVPWGRSSED